MRFKSIFMAAALCLTAMAATPAAHAQQQPEQTKMTLAKANDVLNALLALDGYDKEIKDGASSKSVHVFYDLSGNLRLLIAGDIDALKAPIAQFSKARQGLVDQAGGSGKTGDDYAKWMASPEGVKAAKDVQALLDTEGNYTLGKIKDAELKLDVNPIPASVLSMLSPIRTQ